MGIIKKSLIKTAIEKKLINLRAYGEYTHVFYDLLFSEVRNRLGGRVWFIASGSAPMA